MITVIGGAALGAVNLIFGDGASQPSEHAVEDIPTTTYASTKPYRDSARELIG